MARGFQQPYSKGLVGLVNFNYASFDLTASTATTDTFEYYDSDGYLVATIVITYADTNKDSVIGGQRTLA